MRNLTVVVSGGVLALTLALAASPLAAWGSALPAAVARATLLKPDPALVVRDSAVRPDHGPVLPPDPW